MRWPWTAARKTEEHKKEITDVQDRLDVVEERVDVIAEQVSVLKRNGDDS